MEPQDLPSLDMISDLEYAIWKVTVVKAAVELDIFTVIARGYKTLSDIAAHTGYNSRGLQCLLDALCPLGLLKKGDGRYMLTPTLEALFVKGSPTYYGDWFLQARLAWDTRGRVAERIKTGAPVGPDVSQMDSEGLWVSNFAHLLVTWPDSAEPVWKMWELLGITRETTSGLHILDAGCGSGIKSFVLAQADPGVRVTAVDFPEVLGIAEKIADAMGVNPQVLLCPGDILHADFGVNQYDIILFGAVLHFFNADHVRDVLKKAYNALNPGGRVVICTPVPDEERCQSEKALVMAFELFLFVPESNVYTFSEYKTLLEKEGFTSVVHHSDFVVSARK